MDDGTVANLAVIKYHKILAEDVAEQELLLEACVKWGFFYLDLSHSQGAEYLDVVKDIFNVSKEYFARPLEEKLKDTSEDMSTFNICGYKPLGLDAGNVDGKKDGCEGLRIPSEICHGVTEDKRLFIPSGIQSQWSTFQAFACKSHMIASDILKGLSSSMKLEGSARFENHHTPTASSTSTVVLQCYPLTGLAPDVTAGHFTHTDTGSITILFNTDWGLQVHSPDSETWEYVPPRPNYAIVNVGDALKFMSQLRLTSSLHRVAPRHMKWVSGPRYATIFFLRPDNEAEFVDLEGEHWTAKGWLNRKFGNYRNSHQEQEKTTISTGKTGFLGLWDEKKAMEQMAGKNKNVSS